MLEKCSAIFRVEDCERAKVRNNNETRKILIQRRNYDLTSDPVDHINISMPFQSCWQFYVYLHFKLNFQKLLHAMTYFNGFASIYIHYMVHVKQTNRID